MKSIRPVLLAALWIPLGRLDASEVYFPHEAAGGYVSLWSSGTLFFTGNGWAHIEKGKVDLRLQWQDTKDDLLMLMSTWTLELPEGRWILGAERSEQLLTFTLTAEGGTNPALRSPAFEIHRWTRIVQEWKDGEPGATDNPDDAQRLREDH